MDDPNSYFLPREAHGADLAPWAELLPSECRVLRATLFGDLILVDEGGEVYLLEIASAAASKIATSEEDFWRKVAADEDGWQLRPLVDQCRAAGMILDDGQCYAFTTPPYLGGDYTVENVWMCSWREWLSFTANVYLQTKDVPDGATVTFRPAD